MAPYIEPGDLVVYRPTTGARLAAGQVVSFVPPGASTPVTHRISAVEPGRAGTVTATTRGDANQVDDQNQVAFPREQRVWQVRWWRRPSAGPSRPCPAGTACPSWPGCCRLSLRCRRAPVLTTAIAAHDPPEGVPAGG